MIVFFVGNEAARFCRPVYVTHRTLNSRYDFLDGAAGGNQKAGSAIVTLKKIFTLHTIHYMQYNFRNKWFKWGPFKLSVKVKRLPQ